MLLENVLVNADRPVPCPEVTHLMHADRKNQEPIRLIQINLIHSTIGVIVAVFFELFFDPLEEDFLCFLAAALLFSFSLMSIFTYSLCIACLCLSISARAEPERT